MRRHAVEALAAIAAALALTMLMAASTLRAPSERLFGADIVGRHHDPFTVIQQFARPVSLGVYSQPVTDLAGAAMARATNAVAAYNWLVLVSFPLSAGVCYLLARHLALSRAGALFASLVFAFSPFHLAHAAYHPHIAQTQWLPLYLLALWRCLDEATLVTIACLAAATAAVTLSNFYGGLIAAVITPIAIGGYWFIRTPTRPRGARHLGVTIGTLACLLAAATAVAWLRDPALVRDRAQFAFPREELFWYSAKWWSYLMPPVASPLAGGIARHIWNDARVGDALLEQQVSLGWSIVALALAAIGSWVASTFPYRLGGPGRGGEAADAGPRRRDTAVVPMLAAIAIAALICSLSPDRTIAGVTFARPSAWLYRLVPMFRSYARFGVIVQLMAALLAGIGATHLFAHRTGRSRAIAAALVLLAIAEYTVWPAALSRDVFPTAAHRWAMQLPAGSRTFDCAPLTAESSSVAWLSDGRIALAGEEDDCAEPQLGAKLQARGFTHLLVRDTWERRRLLGHGAANGLCLVRQSADADLFSIRSRTAVYTQQIAGFWPREHDGEDTWRWMGPDGSWTIVSAGRSLVTLDIHMRAFHISRPLAVRLDAGAEQTVVVNPVGRTYRLGPLALTAGSHRLTFHSLLAPIVADTVLNNGDGRALSIAIGAWKWSAE